MPLARNSSLGIEKLMRKIIGIVLNVERIMIVGLRDLNTVRIVVQK